MRTANAVAHIDCSIMPAVIPSGVWKRRRGRGARGRGRESGVKEGKEGGDQPGGHGHARGEQTDRGN